VERQNGKKHEHEAEEREKRDLGKGRRMLYKHGGWWLEVVSKVVYSRRRTDEQVRRY
jgi:hypothetical protein